MISPSRTSRDPLIFSDFSSPHWRHGFFLRDEAEASYHHQLKQLGWSADEAVQAEQTHGNGVMVVDASHRGQTIPGVDALITRSAGLPLIIRVADCAPVYLGDPESGTIALIHSGRKGTELNILQATVEHLKETCGVNPENLEGVIGPCIRPPDYEVDFAAEIGRQAAACGLARFYDCGLNTAADLTRFYSYRAEKGKTGRHWAVLALASDPGR
jgi:YfiH family protein